MKDPFDKAKELIERFLPYVQWQDSKQCALIAVDEILDVVGTSEDDDFYYDYYLEVQQEIEKM